MQSGKRQSGWTVPQSSARAIGKRVVKKSTWKEWLDIVRVEYLKEKVSYLLEQRIGDPRPYLKISILGKEFTGLFDTGASCTVINLEFWAKLKRLGLEIEPVGETSVTVANGNNCRILGKVNVPFVLHGKCLVVPSIVVYDMDAPLILGVDFIRNMDITVDIVNSRWEFPSGNNKISSISTSSGIGPPSAQNLEDLYELTAQYFSKMGGALGCAKGVEHRIDTGDAEPVKQRYYAISPYVQERLNKELDKMLELGVVETSQSPWSSPVVLVRKSNGDTRVCVDLRKVNQICKKDAYPVPYISMILDRLRGAKVLSSLDIKNAYWQVRLEKSSREKTAFTIPGRGLFQFARMPMGISNASATWQRVIDKVLGADLEEHVFVYLDDIVVVTSDYESHLRILRIVFERLLASGLTLNREKCQFFREELKYLGYIIGREGLRVDPEKVSAILNYPTPKTVREVRRFVGMTSWYRRFIKDFSERMKPLTNLTRKNVHFQWSEQAERSFAEMKQCLVSAPSLTCPDFRRPFILQTDASQIGLGAALSQEFPDGEKVIAYASRSLTSAESNYTTTEIECLCVIWAVEKFRAYLEGAEFTVITDHHSLLYLYNLKNPTSRLARWALRLQEYRFNIVHRKGKEHAVPDALSRAIPAIASMEVQTKARDKWYERMRERIRKNPENFPRWKVEDGTMYKFVDRNRLNIGEESSWKLVVSKPERKEILAENHDAATAGHLGVFKTRKRIAQNYYWPGMNQDIHRYVRRCEVCLAYKADNQSPAGLLGRRTVSRPWQMICSDLMGPFPLSKKKNRFL